MGVKQVPISSDDAWNIPLAAIFCIAIAAYVILVIIGRHCKGCVLLYSVLYLQELKLIEKSMIIILP